MNILYLYREKLNGRLLRCYSMTIFKPFMKGKM